MQFVINGMKYETDNMEMVAEVKKWYRVDNTLTRAMYPGKELDGNMRASCGNLQKGTGF